MKIVLSCFIALVLFEANTCKKKTECIDKSKIDTTCMCTREYAPVCGCDGKTYSNKCEAGCHGVTSWTDGECKTENK